MMPIIFSDESSIEIQEFKGIWRKPGTYPPQTFYPRDVKQMSVMIWGGIGPKGYRTKLLYFDKHINSDKYIQSLQTNKIFDDIKAKFGDLWVWQQDNAPSHRSQKTINYLQYNIPYLFDWPAKSPDLMPIEQIWNYLKVKIRGKEFNLKNDLFKAQLK